MRTESTHESQQQDSFELAARLFPGVPMRWLGVSAASVAMCAAVLFGSGGASSAGAVKATRLVHGPLVLRLTGQAAARREDPTVDWRTMRYAVVFKLNRDPLARYKPSAEVAAIRTRGHVSFETFPLDDTLTPYNGSNGPPGTKFCFIAFVDEEPTVPYVRKLDRIALGTSVKTNLQFLTPKDGTQVLGKSYTIRATLRSADVQLNDARSKRLFRRIGC